MKGFVNINKPKGMTSSDVVVIVRGILRKFSGEKNKVGHLGTLDPQGTGVLPIAVGTATRTFDYMQNKTKVYQATFVFGQTTDTLDGDGKVIKTCDVVPTCEQIDAVLDDLCGNIEQIPPMYSAKSIGGQRAYDLARKGVDVELKPKLVKIFSIQRIQDKYGVVELQNGEKTLAKNEYAFEICCSGGTYIRSIARDMATSLGSVAYMSSIHRIKNGNFMIEDAVSIEEFEKEPFRYLKSFDDALSDFERFEVEESIVDKVLNGVRVKVDNLPDNNFLVVARGEIIGIGEGINGVLVVKTRL